MKVKPCNYCHKTNHTSLQCFNKPRRSASRKPDPIWEQVVAQWKLLNPGPTWECYLRISDMCIWILNNETLTLDHIIPKGRGKQYKYDINNLMPACVFCNGLKGSRTLQVLSRDFPHLRQYIKVL